MFLDSANERAVIGDLQTPGLAYGLAASGDRAYVAGYHKGLQIIDICNPANPVIIGSVNTPDYAVGVAVSGSEAYVAVGNSGLQIIDIRIPTSPRIISSVDIPDTPGVLRWQATGLMWQGAVEATW